MIWTCLKCGLELDEYSRPHYPRPTRTLGDARRHAYLLTHDWANYEDMPKSLHSIKDVCWGTVVNTPKYNKPIP